MQKVNSIYHKQVINQSTGERVASVRDIVLSEDGRQMVALVAGEGMWSNDERCIRWDAVRSVGDYVIVEGAAPFASVGEDPEVDELRNQAHQITDKMVVSSTGERLGNVGDMFFEDSGRIVGYSIKRGMLGGTDDALFLPAEQVQVVGKDAIIATAGDLKTVKDVELIGDMPQDSADRARQEPITRDLRERAVSQRREPLPDLPRDPYNPPIDMREPSRMPREPLPDDRGID